MLYIRYLIGLALLVLVAFSFKTNAQVEWNGFASMRGTHVTTEGGSDPFLGFSNDELSFKSESLFALQARTYLSDELTATIQLYSPGLNDFKLEAKWAYLTYHFNTTHQLSMGKLVNPLFQHSTYEKVGLTHNFARLPKSVYIGFDFNTIEGVEFVSQYEISDYTLMTRVIYGGWDGQTYSAPIDRHIPLGLKELKGINGILQYDWWSLSAGYIAGTVKASQVDSEFMIPLMQPSIDEAIAAGATEQEISTFIQAVTDDGKRAEYTFIGFNIDYGGWLLELERVDYGIQGSLNPQNKGWYIALGKRVRDVTVMVHREDYSRRQGDYRSLEPVTNPILQNAGREVKDLFTSRSFDGSGVTIRWDFHPQAAFKIDYFEGVDTRESVGKYKIASFGIDLVF